MSVTVAVSGGAPPVNWSMTASQPLANVSASFGSLAGPGAIQWRGEFSVPGSVVWFLQVDDGAMASLVVNGTLRVLPAPTAHLLTPPAGTVAGHPIALAAEIEGGVGPYLYEFTLSDQESGLGNASRSGTVYWNATPSASGSLGLRVRVLDALGNPATSNETIYVGVGSPSGGSPPAGAPTASAGFPSASSLGAWGLGVGGLTVAVGLFFAPRWRRRFGRSAKVVPDSRALGVVRRLLRGTDGLDRETLYFLAEEEGLPENASATAVERWHRAGRVRIDTGLEGQDLVQWTEPAPSATADPESRPSAEEELAE